MYLPVEKEPHITIKREVPGITAPGLEASCATSSPSGSTYFPVVGIERSRQRSRLNIPSIIFLQSGGVLIGNSCTKPLCGIYGLPT